MLSEPVAFSFFPARPTAAASLTQQRMLSVDGFFLPEVPRPELLRAISSDSSTYFAGGRNWRKLTGVEQASVYRAVLKASPADEQIGTARWHRPHALLDCTLRNSRSQFREDLLLLPILLAIRSSLSGPGSEVSGTFVELGALDGLDVSNTLMLERCYNWTGLLIEASPENVARLRNSGRRAPYVHSAVCARQGMIRMSTVGGATARVLDATSRDHDERPASLVPCQPLASLMRTAGLPEATFLSLDVEGMEEEVLMTVDPTAFDLIVVEARHDTPEKNGRVRERVLQAGLCQLSRPWVKWSDVFLSPRAVRACAAAGGEAVTAFHRSSRHASRADGSDVNSSRLCRYLSSGLAAGRARAGPAVTVASSLAVGAALPAMSGRTLPAAIAQHDRSDSREARLGGGIRHHPSDHAPSMARARHSTSTARAAAAPFDVRSWLGDQPGCRIYVAQPEFADRKGRTLYDSEHREDQYALHYYLQAALAAHPWRTYNRSAADVVFFNASFSFRHELRISARDRLWREVERVRPVDNGCFNTTWPLLFATDFSHHLHLPNMPPRARLVKELQLSNSDLVAPSVVASPPWLVQSGLEGQQGEGKAALLRTVTGASRRTAGDVSSAGVVSSAPAFVPWEQRKLLLFGGHIPMIYLQPTRFLIWKQLYRDPRASVYAATLCRMRAMASCDKSDAELLSGDDLFLQKECFAACSPSCPCERRVKQRCLDQPRMRSGGLAAFRHRCARGFTDPFFNFSATFRDAGPLAAQAHRLDRTEYLRQASRHRFCLVAPGDYVSTPKVTEAISLAAVGGCLPLIVADSADALTRLPYSDKVNYCSVAFIIRRHKAENKMRDILDELNLVNASEHAIRRQNARRLLPAFVSREGSSPANPSAAEMVLAEMCALAQRQQLAGPDRPDETKTGDGHHHPPTHGASPSACTAAKQRRSATPRECPP